MPRDSYYGVNGDTLKDIPPLPQDLADLCAKYSNPFTPKQEAAASELIKVIADEIKASHKPPPEPERQTVRLPRIIVTDASHRYGRDGK